MESFEILFYYYIACILGIVGFVLLFTSLFFIKQKSGKVAFGISLILLVPISYFKVYEIRSEIEMWNNLGPLLQAIDKNKYNKVKQLIEEGQDVNKENHQAYPSTPLSYAIDKKNIRIVRLLVENGADVNGKSWRNGSTHLNYAIDIGDTAILNYLLEHGADISLKYGADSIYSIEYATAILSASKDVVEVLLKHGADANCNQGAPLEGAVNNNNYEVVRCLLEYGANVEPYLSELKNQAKSNLKYLKGRSSFPEDSIKTVKILELLEEYTSKKEED